MIHSEDCALRIPLSILEENPFSSAQSAVTSLNNERNTIIGWHTEGCVRPNIGREAQKLESGRTALWWVGNLSRQGVAG